MPLAALKNVFGYDRFRPGQHDIIQAILDGAHVLAVMPTGAGKSMCFQIPALVLGGLTIVVSPLVALMEDQVAALKLAGVEAETINSSRSRDSNVAAWRRVASGQTRLLYLAPERLMTARMIAALQRLPVRLIAIDEAHCLSRWGPSFRPEYESLTRLGELFLGVPIAALTATADAATQRDIVDKLFAGAGKVFVSGFDRPNIHLAVDARTERNRQLLDIVRAHPGESGIVYCLSRDKTEKTARLLCENGYRALPYHAGMDAAERTHHQKIFMDAPGVIIVATIAFGMGIDKPDVRFVAHTDMPGSVEAYYQEIGRAGRDGEAATAHMIYGLDDVRMRRMFIEQENTADDHKQREHKRLDALIGYCETPGCRRQTLLAYFGETTAPCGNCDMCLNPPELHDASDSARIALGAVEQSGQIYGAAHIIDIVRGAKTQKITSAGHHALAAYGAGAETPKERWRSILRQMTGAGFLRLDVAGYGGLAITSKGRDLMAGTEIFQCRVERHGITAQNRKTNGKTSGVLADLNDEERALFDALKSLRRELAHERGVPAYAVFTDRTLAEMARKKPTDIDAFSRIHGVGVSKVRDFAATFLGEIAHAE
ncbi:DNA helicase RecQ [Varunaivibrio sulfuroxidans]|uniref:DNA helicase RecQ n=1 Tax=Varunaivibrio sulfuroxidans TaxID=1773489 RepID=A0A4R3JEF8_9PROT|nr:DNA helicase RecQ [Varunaivibrio sulfuroxidans]TCS63486.1 ATP-dependent DNA helicase RecQ [Varunaivibrio sulfuroxidans]WES30369.1 DNA helicase RecQ [Varunaivibrio sulfuroxidans]